MSRYETFKRDIKSHIQKNGISQTAFGRKSVGDPNFVFDIMNGRQPSLGVVDRVYAYMNRKEGEERKEPA